MNRNRIILTAALVLATIALAGVEAQASAPATAPVAQKQSYLSPTALAAASDGKTLFIACATANQVAMFDTGAAKVNRVVNVPESPLGFALSGDGKQLYVTCAAPESRVCIVDVASAKVVANIPAGHTAMAPVLSPDGRTLYICNRFDNEVAFIDLGTKKTTKRAKVPREPVAAAVTLDGKFLLVANHIHSGRADEDVVASSVSVIDTASGRVVKEIALPNGSGLLRDVRISPDGKYACVTHLLSRFHLPTTQVDRGWINSNALSLIDLAELKLINTVLLDNIDRGAGNPWAAAWSADGKTLCVTHAGTHELSVIDFPALLAKLARFSAAPDPKAKVDYSAASRTAADVPNDLSFLVGLRQRIKLPESDRGPRAVTLLGTKAYLANYFSDTLSVIDLAGNACAASIALGPTREMSVVRRGELLFNDATMCFQGWQSCASCHSSDARVDGLNWDNLNDGIGNPKNAKSLLLAHQTPPSMWLGVRSNAFVSVRAGIRNSLFTVRPEEDAVALDEYLKSLKPIPSPHLAKGKLSPAALRGKKVFFNDDVGCADCHKGALYTDMKLHDVGTVGKFDQSADRFDTPSLIEVWRSAPYLHDGRAVSVRDVTTTCNKKDEHGKTSRLTKQQIDDLVEYVLSL
jgi:YVTN family beta-propeller protein